MIAWPFGNGIYAILDTPQMNDILGQAQLTNPPAWLLWLATISTLILVLLQIWEILRKHPHIQFKQIVAHRYYSEVSIEDVHNWGHYLFEPLIGDPKRVFTVLEFTITNNYPYSISIGRISVDDWIFSDQYSRYAYDSIRDYRIYDLFNGRPSSLATYSTLSPSQAIGFRIEVYEYQGDNTVSRVRTRVTTPSKYLVNVTTDVKSQQFWITKIQNEKLERDWDFRNIYRWSGTELISELPQSLAMVFPQGIYPPGQNSKQSRSKRFYSFVKEKISKVKSLTSNVTNRG